eukprot:TRINITY_DN10770_c0_g1_i1.p1 TRINITY_DN10770_c0_g1~~TRINITY_DN10770_c0_g1_i1.p1  ORF type:complete len:417 (+),score=142.28 TRINITY_DN10770_c0_g1_i1:193-1443(+)
MSRYGGPPGPPSKRGRMDMLSPGEVEMELKKVNDNLPENHIILITVINAIYPINVSTLHKVCRSIGEVDRLVIFEKGTFVQALVEFRTIAHAAEAKKNLHGCDIYNNACTLKVEFARQERLNVKRNDDKTWDFTQTEDFGKVKDEPNIQRKVLLNEGPPTTGLGGPSRFGSMSSGSGFGGSGGMDHMGGFGGFDEGQRGGWGGGYQMDRSPVLMIYSLDPDRFNCQRLFNLLCLYGNIVKINFLKSKEGCAMVEFSDPEAVDRAARNLNQMKMFGVRLRLEQSRKTHVEDIRKPHELPDGSDSFQSFLRDRNNRFDTPERAAKNRIIPPTKILHFYNVPKMDDDRLIDVFAEQHAPCPTRVKWFEAKSAKSASGLAEFDTVEDSVEALVMVNNTKVECEDEGRPYDMKLCFSRANN